MVIFLLLGIFILLIVSYFLFYKNILNPTSILCSVFLVCLSFTILNIDNWGINYSIKSSVLILGTIFSFLIGNSLVLVFPNPKNKINCNFKNKYLNEKYVISFKKIIIIDIILIYLLYIYFKNIYIVSIHGGNTEGYSKMLYYAREQLLLFGGLKRINMISFLLAKGMAYICYFLYIHILIFEKIKWRKLYLLTPMVIYICFAILTTGRTPFIHLFVYCLVVYFVLLLQNYNFDSKINRKVILYSCLLLMLFFVLFLFLGKLKSSGRGVPVFQLLSIYTGSSLAAFNEFVNNYTPQIHTFGANTLFRIYGIAEKLGFKVPDLYAPYEFIQFKNGVSTNIYTAMRRYFEDFGTIGLFLISNFLGSFYGLFFHYVCYRRDQYFLLILYSSLCYPIFEFPIEERFLMKIFPNDFLYNIFFIGVLYYLILYKFSKKKEKKGAKNDINNRSTRSAWTGSTKNS